jgi:hypothetical protein
VYGFSFAQGVFRKKVFFFPTPSSPGREPPWGVGEGVVRRGWGPTSQARHDAQGHGRARIGCRGGVCVAGRGRARGPPWPLPGVGAAMLHLKP